MPVGIASANPAYSLQSVLSAEIALFTAIDQESSGSAISSASANPSGLAIYNNLSTQAQAADTAQGNIADASDAVDVAQGAASTIQTSLDQINNLAIEANNGFNSASDDAALQAQASSLAQGINQIAGETKFNGTPLLDGTTSGSTAPTAATANVTTNDAVSAGGNVVASATASGATTSGTFNVTVDNGGNADITYTDSTTQQTTNVGSFAANASTTYDGTTITVGNISASDAGQTATVQTTAATGGAQAGSVSVQTGTSEGDVTNVSFANASTSGLGITNIDLTNQDSATNTEGQIGNAITSLGNAQASLGAQSVALGYASTNDAILSNNLTASASAIGDTSEANASIAGNLASIQQQISIAVLARANNDAGHLNSFLSQYA